MSGDVIAGVLLLLFLLLFFGFVFLVFRLLWRLGSRR